MKLSRKFVSDYIDLPDVSISEIADAMTSVGNEYDSAGKLIEATNLVVGKVIESHKHPEADKLRVNKVDVGTDVLDIVCGAPNCREGIKVIVAKVGAELPMITIKSSVIRGEKSNGMLCALNELGIENKYLNETELHGIHELPEDAVVGSDPLKYLVFDDEVIDFELTSNRGDLLSIIGMAYELGAIYKKEVKDIDVSYNEVSENINDSFELKVETSACPLFLAKKVKNLKIGESPEFIKSRLIASGIRPINNIVDISNYVMLETGQPLHFYDADSLGNNIVVRQALDNENLITLDSIERTLSVEDIVIANKNDAIGLAGVMGGHSTEVESTTKNIIIESAIFDNIMVRKTSKKILRSEASNRFEKGLDPKRTYMAISRACHLLEKYASGEVLSGLVQYDALEVKEEIITVPFKKVEKVLGIKISNEEIISILKSLGFIVTVGNDDFTVTIPSRRLDIHIPEDVIEEVGRIYGIDNIQGKLPTLNCQTGKFNKNKREVRNKMVSFGFNETVSYSLISESDFNDFTLRDKTLVKINDPMSIDRNTLRYSLLSSLVKIYEYNKARNYKDVCIFEIAKGFYKEETYKEDLKLAALMSGSYVMGVHKEKVDFYYLKGVVEEFLNYFGFENRYSFVVQDIPQELHPGQSANIIVNGKSIGIIGKVHPNFSKDNMYVFEINLDQLFSIKVSKMAFKELSKYPSIKKDVAFIVDKNVNSEVLEKAIKKSAGKLLTNIEVFDVHTSENIGLDKKSIAYSLTFSDKNQTLTDLAVMEVFNKIIIDVQKNCNAILRDK